MGGHATGKSCPKEAHPNTRGPRRFGVTSYMSSINTFRTRAHVLGKVMLPIILLPDEARNHDARIDVVVVLSLLRLLHMVRFWHGHFVAQVVYLVEAYETSTSGVSTAHRCMKQCRAMFCLTGYLTAGPREWVKVGWYSDGWPTKLRHASRSFTWENRRSRSKVCSAVLLLSACRNLSWRVLICDRSPVQEEDGWIYVERLGTNEQVGSK